MAGQILGVSLFPLLRRTHSPVQIRGRICNAIPMPFWFQRDPGL